jgi:hypothetical protein
MASGYDSPMLELTLSPSHRSMNSATALTNFQIGSSAALTNFNLVA